MPPRKIPEPLQSILDVLIVLWNFLTVSLFLFWLGGYVAFKLTVIRGDPHTALILALLSAILNIPLIISWARRK